MKLLQLHHYIGLAGLAFIAAAIVAIPSMWVFFFLPIGMVLIATAANLAP